MPGMLTNDTLPVSGNPNQGVQTRAGYAPRERIFPIMQHKTAKSPKSQKSGTSEFRQLFCHEVLHRHSVYGVTQVIFLFCTAQSAKYEHIND